MYPMPRQGCFTIDNRARLPVLNMPCPSCLVVCARCLPVCWCCDANWLRVGQRKTITTMMAMLATGWIATTTGTFPPTWSLSPLPPSSARSAHTYMHILLASRYSPRTTLVCKQQVRSLCLCLDLCRSCFCQSLSMSPLLLSRAGICPTPNTLHHTRVTLHSLSGTALLG